MYRLWDTFLAPFLLFCFEMRSYYVALGGFQIPCVNKEFLTVLKKGIHLPLSSRYWNGRFLKVDFYSLERLT